MIILLAVILLLDFALLCLLKSLEIGLAALHAQYAYPEDITNTFLAVLNLNATFDLLFMAALI